MSSVRKFLFDDSFDIDPAPRGRRLPEPEPEPVAAEPPPPPPPTFSEAELAAARQQGYAEGEKAGKAAGYGQGFGEGNTAGRKAGHEQAKAELEKQLETRLAASLDRIGAGVDQLLTGRAQAAAERRDQPVHLALAIVRKLLPEYSRRHGLGEIEGMVRQCLTELMDEPRLLVRVAPDMVDPVREHLEPMAGSRGFGAKLMVLEEPSLGRGDCRVEWAEGGAERNTAQLIAEIEACAARLLEAPPQ